MKKEIRGKRIILREQREEDALFFCPLVQPASGYVSVWL